MVKLLAWTLTIVCALMMMVSTDAQCLPHDSPVSIYSHKTFNNFRINN